MILNSWTLMESLGKYQELIQYLMEIATIQLQLDHHPDFNTSFICHQRNFCEMGQNSKVFGHGSDTMTQMVYY